MNNAIIITLIICITLIIMSLISAFEKAHARKQVVKRVKKFTDAFGDLKPSKTEPKEDKPLKFGDED